MVYSQKLAVTTFNLLFVLDIYITYLKKPTLVYEVGFFVLNASKIQYNLKIFRSALKYNYSLYKNMVNLIKADSAQQKPRLIIDNTQKPQLTTDNAQEPQHFFTISTFKFIVMLVATLGLYKLYWSYKNWVFIKHKTGRDILPFWRVVFGIFWVYSFLKYIKLFSLKARLQIKINPWFWAALLIILSLSGKLLSKMFPFSVYELITSSLYFLIIIRFNNIALKINQKLIPNFQNNTKFSLSNYIAIGIGGIIWLLIIYGLFVNEDLSSGNELYDNGRYEEAIEFYDKVIKDEPKSSIAYSNKCAALNGMGKYEMALEICNKALELDNSNSLFYKNKAHILEKLGRNDEAQAAYDAAVIIDAESETRK